MKLLVGLGNPGKKYEKTRHNAGFMALDVFTRTCEEQGAFFLNAREKNTRYEATEYIWAHGDKKETILCVWPQLFMNRSGEVIREFVRSHGKKLTLADDLIVLHDDIDIPIGRLKVDKNASSGGHKGVQNTIDQLGVKDFVRFRIGIQPLRKTSSATEDFVIKKFSKEEEKTLSGVYDTVAGALHYFLENGLEKTQNLYNKK